MPTTSSKLPAALDSVPRVGTSTPLEALGRLMYHTGIHAGQISQIQRAFHAKEKERTH
ncbi:hypothetical protein ACWKW1_20915 [Brevibacillus parabrevis]